MLIKRIHFIIMQRSIGLLICYLCVAFAYETTLYFDSSCSFYGNTYRIYDDDDTYNVRWNGGPLSSSCKMSFDPVDPEKKICVKVYSYDVNYCGMKLKYYGGLIATVLKRTYSCYDSKPEEFCGETLNDVAVQISSVSSPSSSYFSLKVYRKSPVHFGVIIGCSVAGAIATIVIVTIVVVACRRRRASAGTVYRNTTGYQQTIVTATNNTTNMNYGGITNQNMNSYPPPPYPGTTNTGYNGTTYPATTQPTGYSGTYPGTQQAPGYSDPTSQKYQ